MNLMPKDSSLFKLAMMVDVLPLPPDVCDVADLGDSFIFRGSLITNVFRPAASYIRNSIMKIKSAPKYTSKRKNTLLNLYDRLGRPYSLDLTQVYKEWLAKPSQRHLLDVGESKNMFDMFKRQSLAKQIIANGQLQREIMNKSYKIDNKTNINSNLRDIHMIDLMKELGLDLKEDIHLLMVIEEFIRDKEK